MTPTFVLRPSRRPVSLDTVHTEPLSLDTEHTEPVSLDTVHTEPVSLDTVHTLVQGTAKGHHGDSHQAGQEVSSFTYLYA